MKKKKLVIGVDYGTDSVRTVLIDTQNGKEISSAVSSYSRWKSGKYCDPDKNQWRQHPLDYLESLEMAITEMMGKTSMENALSVVGIGIDTTGSTPVAVDKTGTPLALLDKFQDNPNAMFILWKDHTAIREAEEINQLCARWEIDYTKYEGGVYSSEWFWAKLLQVIRKDPDIRQAAYSWVEHCDWIPFTLCGGQDIHTMKRSRCAAGHKAMWHEDFAGLPANDFFKELDPLLDGINGRLFSRTYTSDQPAGKLSSEWADKLGLSRDVVVAVGGFDAHMGAVGGQIEPYYLSKVMGTSTCDMLVAPLDEIGQKLVHGICGQVDGSVIPGMLGLEAGQSAFGDIYAWFRDLLCWPLENVLMDSSVVSKDQKEDLSREIRDKLIPYLSKAAEKIDPTTSAIVALDWLNGRRTPDANQSLKGAIAGLSLGSDAPKVFRALVEATCFGAKSIVDRFQMEGIPIKGIIGLGGVAKKSPFIMQTMANVLNRPIRIARSEQTCALGAAMFAATCAEVFDYVEEAMAAMGSGFDAEYQPQSEMAEIYEKLYANYLALGSTIEKLNF
jgi:L-ribulokinase